MDVSGIPFLEACLTVAKVIDPCTSKGIVVA
jgi:hypothetical protein